MKSTAPTVILGMVIFCVLATDVIPFTFASIISSNNYYSIDIQYKKSLPTNFTIIALPDTQHYTVYFPEIFTNQTKWIVANREALNIVYVAHEGDITDGGTKLEFQRASTSMSLLENPSTTGLPYGIPYTIIPGDHDKDIYNMNNYFNNYFNYTRFEERSYYGGHYSTNNDNNYALFNASGMDFIAIGLDVWPDEDEIGWADNLLQTYPNRRAIVISHDVLDACGGWRHSGKAIYNGLKHNSNLFLILCGHCRYHEGESRRTDVYNDSTIYSLLSDYQEYPNGGNGYLRIMKFCPAEDKIFVQTYSPYINQYISDENSQFNLTYYMTSPPPLICHAGGPYIGEKGQPVSFNGTAHGGTLPYTWAWTFGDGSTSSDQNPNHIYIYSGIYNVTLAVTDANFNVSKDFTLTIIPKKPKTKIDRIINVFSIKKVIKNI